VQPVSALAVVDSPVSSHLREPSPVDLLAAKVYAAIPDLSAMPAATPAQALATNTKTPGQLRSCRADSPLAIFVATQGFLGTIE
jgi:hypothetical protein